MNLSPTCFAQLTRMLVEDADELCGGRLVLVHEGGYSPPAEPYCGLAVIEQLSSHGTGVPLNALVDGKPENRPLHQHERDAMSRAAVNVGLW
jgi:acetoin utilization deacetylase AcuC-like enzyme